MREQQNHKKMHAQPTHDDTTTNKTHKTSDKIKHMERGHTSLQYMSFAGGPTQALVRCVTLLLLFDTL
jgi:hypothetical protein